jgi:hypothetical protein
VRLTMSPLGTSATVGLLYQPRMSDDDYGAVGGIRIGRGNRSTRRKPAPVPLCPPHIPHDLTWDRTRAAAVGSQRLTAWAMARPRNRVIWRAVKHLNYIQCSCYDAITILSIFGPIKSLMHISMSYISCDCILDDSYTEEHSVVAKLELMEANCPCLIS